MQRRGQTQKGTADTDGQRRRGHSLYAAHSVIGNVTRSQYKPSKLAWHRVIELCEYQSGRSGIVIELTYEVSHDEVRTKSKNVQKTVKIIKLLKENLCTCDLSNLG